MKEKQIRTKINRKEWRVCLVNSSQMSRNSWGECDDPSVSNPEIWVNRNAKNKDLLDTLIHETIHAVRPELAEEAVLETASTIADVLWKIGYRVKEKDD